MVVYNNNGLEGTVYMWLCLGHLFTFTLKFSNLCTNLVVGFKWSTLLLWSDTSISRYSLPPCTEDCKLLVRLQNANSKL